jgi:hypothetical protein
LLSLSPEGSTEIIDGRGSGGSSGPPAMCRPTSILLAPLDDRGHRSDLPGPPPRAPVATPWPLKGACELSREATLVTLYNKGCYCHLAIQLHRT